MMRFHRLLVAALVAMIVGPFGAMAASGPPVSALTTIAPTGSTGILALGDALAQAPNIMSFTGVKGDGVTDDSAAIKAAHDQVVANGGRFIYFPARTFYAPSLGQVGNVIFVGPGSLSGTYRKKIIPVTATTNLIPGEINPALHLKAFSATPTPIVVVTGDSTATETPTPNITTIQDTFDRMLRARLDRANPGKTITYYNRGVPGTNWTDLNGVAGGTHTIGTIPTWYSPTSATWLSFIQSLAPDLVVIKMGTNDSAGIVASDMLGVITKLQAFAKVPDIVLVTPAPRSSMYAGINNPYDQNGRDLAAGLERSFARIKGLGLLDVHRQSVLSIDGYDVENTAGQDVITTSAQVTTTLPYSFPEAVHDFDITVQLDNSSGALFGSASGYNNGGNRVQVASVGGLGSTAVQLFDLGGYLSISVLGNGGLGNFPQVNNIVPTPTGAFLLRVAVKGTTLYVDINGTQAFSGQYYTRGGVNVSSTGVYTPPNINTSVSTGNSLKVLHLSLGRNKLYMPALTDVEAWGTVDGLYPFGGNGTNHMSAIGLETVEGGLLDRTNFVAPPSPTTAPGVSAAGTTLATATKLTADKNLITTCASGAGVVLNGLLGKTQEVSNAVTGNACLVYPPSASASINGGTAGAAASLAAATAGSYPHGAFTCLSATVCVQGP